MCCTLQSSKELQSSEALAESTIRSFLGPNKCLKFIVDDNETHLISCALPLYQVVSLNSPFENVIEETLYAHHEQFGFGSTSLLAIWYFWHRELKYLQDCGIQTKHIIITSQAALKYLISILPNQEISIKKNLPTVMKDISAKKYPISKESKNSLEYKIKLRSRHFAVGDESSFSSKIILSEKSFKEISCLCAKIGHTSSEVATLFAKIWKEQIQKSHLLKFNSEFFTVVKLIGQKSITLLPGLLIELNSTILNKNLLNENIKHRMLLVTGDITLNFMHLGYSSTVPITCIKNFDQFGDTKFNNWLKACTSHLIQLQISILLVHGSVDENIANFCTAKSIILMDHIPLKTLNCISKNLSIQPVTYLLNSDEQNIISDISISHWSSSSYSSDFILIKTAENHDDFFTFILSHPSSSVLDLNEHQFWHSVSRLTLSVNSKSVFCGGGQTEHWCYQKLLDYIKHQTLEYEQEIIKAIAQGFFLYYNSVSKNQALTGLHGEVFDNVQAKCEMWLSALKLCFCSLQTDLQVINGCTDNTISNAKSYIGTL